MPNSSNWGGYREGSGQKGKWKSGKTKSIRLPDKLHQQITEIAHLLDSEKYTTEELLSCDIKPQFEKITESNDENATFSSDLKNLVNKWQEKAKKTSNPKWLYAKKLLAELEMFSICSKNRGRLAV